MKLKLLAIILLLIFVVVIIGCVDSSLPIYERTDKNGLEDKDGIKVVIDGVEYKMYPALKWTVNPGGEVIGYAGNWNTVISKASGDTKMNFVYLKDRGWTNYYNPLYRTDIVIPEPSADIVNKILYYEQDFRGDDIKRYSNTVTDKEIIKELFNLLEGSEKTSDFLNIKDFSIRISCFSEEVPGAVYNLSIVKYSNRLMVGCIEEGYIAIPIELLDKIAGYKVDYEYFLK